MLGEVAHPTGFEPVTSAFGGRCAPISGLFPPCHPLSLHLVLAAMFLIRSFLPFPTAALRGDDPVMTRLLGGRDDDSRTRARSPDQ